MLFLLLFAIGLAKKSRIDLLFGTIRDGEILCFSGHGQDLSDGEVTHYFLTNENEQPFRKISCQTEKNQVKNFLQSISANSCLK